MKLLQPHLAVDSLADIDLGDWQEKGIRCILIDLDNTIALWRQTTITEEARGLIARARELGINIILFTNAREPRARQAAWDAGISYYAQAGKPFPGKYKRVMAELDYKCDEVMTVGDQIFTDVLGGKLAGCATVLVPPLGEREFAGTKILRFLERVCAGRKLVSRVN